MSESDSQWYVNEKRESTVRALFQVKLISNHRTEHIWDVCILCSSEMVVSMPVWVLIGTEWLHEQREMRRSGYPGPPRPQAILGFHVVLCPLSSPLSSCNRKKHFSLLWPCPLPSSWMFEVSTSGLKPVMSISFILLKNISCTRTSKVFLL